MQPQENPQTGAAVPPSIDPVGRFWLGLSKIKKVISVSAALVALGLATVQLYQQAPCSWTQSCPAEQEIRVTGYNGAEEWVQLTNTGGDPVDLTRWEVRDAAGHGYEFMDVLLAPGDSVVLHTGHGEDGQTDVYWGRNDNVWDDGTEQVVVISPQRCEVDTYTS